MTKKENGGHPITCHFEDILEMVSLVSGSEK
jgi:hypothetical protein